MIIFKTYLEHKKLINCKKGLNATFEDYIYNLHELAGGVLKRQFFVLDDSGLNTVTDYWKFQRTQNYMLLVSRFEIPFIQSLCGFHLRQGRPRFPFGFSF